MKKIFILAILAVTANSAIAAGIDTCEVRWQRVQDKIDAANAKGENIRAMELGKELAKIESECSDRNENTVLIKQIAEKEQDVNAAAQNLEEAKIDRASPAYINKKRRFLNEQRQELMELEQRAE
ncbi:MAG: DUF1090 domain-containing protein [Lactobacillales bacterium]|jgi:hypothetical protein|nr:DUF1090 domain-containing protein [Lactobacillales bacterium]